MGPDSERGVSAPGPSGQGNCADCHRWLSLDESDNDPARFLAHFVAALQTLALPTLSPVEGTQLEGAAAHIGKALRALRSPQPPSPKAPIQEKLLPLVLFELLPGFCLVLFSVRE